MNEKIITADDALVLCERDEGTYYDRKALDISGAKLQRHAVAFANTEGGDLLIGIQDEKSEPDPAKRWAGAATIEAFNGHLQALHSLAPTIPMQLTALKCDGKSGVVLRVSIEKSNEVHATSDGTVYVRVGAQSLPLADPKKIQELAFAKGATSFEDQVTSEARTEDIVDARELVDFLRDYSPKSDPLEFAVNQNLVDRADWKPRTCGLVLFNDNPPAVVPRKCGVRIARYETREDDPEREHLARTFTVEGPLYELIHKTVQQVTDIMSAIKVWTAKGLQNIAYPPEAIWEIVVNALIHRDYSISDDVQILIYDNRIEVISPGRFPGYVTPSNILDARYSRNPKIVRTLSRYSTPPNKDLGEGLNTAFQKMKEWKLRDPEIKEEGNYVKVIIPHIPLAKPTELILEFLETHQTITNSQARDITGIRSENSMKTEFYRLRDAGYLEMVPEWKGSKAAWRLTPAGEKYQDERLARSDEQLPLL